MPAAPVAPAADSLLAVRDLRVAYRAVEIVRGVTLAVPAGGVVALVGGNGAGKTSVLRAVSGLLALHGGRVTGGTVEVAGSPVRGDDPARAVRLGVGHVLEGRRVFADLTVEENLRAGGFTLKNRGLVRERVEWALARFPLLAPRRTTPAGLLSGGEQQLLAVARALVASPRALLLDEPTVGLAGASVDLLAGVVRDVAARGAAVLLAEQDPRLAPAVDADTVAIVGGVLVAPGGVPA